MLNTNLLSIILGCKREFSSLPRVDQHLASLCCQANGNALKQSRNPRAPNEECDNKSIRELTVDILLRKVANIDIARPREVRIESTAMNGPELSGAMRLNRNEMMDSWFGWAKRRTLKHPTVKPSMIAFLKYLFHRGNIKGKSKCSPHAMRILALKFGTSNVAFNGEEYWHEATIRNNGEPEFKEEDVPEEWRVKQIISQFVAELNKKKRATETMTPEDIKIKLVFLLGVDNPPLIKIPGNLDILADKLIDLDKPFHKITQDSIKTLHEASEPKYSKKIIQAISATCKRMDGEVMMEGNVNSEETNEPTVDNINFDGNEDIFMNEERDRMVAEHYESQIEDDHDYILSDENGN